MNQKAHDLLSRLACRLAAEKTGGDESPLHAFESEIAGRARTVDADADVELVNVEGVPWTEGRDNPHAADTWAIDDIPHTEENGETFTKFNHFIDIGAGPDKDGDFNGYSYNLGSACKNEYQAASDALNSPWQKVVANMVSKPVDGALAYWLNDEYVHVSADPWYQNCSPAMDRYSYPKGGKTVQEDLKQRFPLATVVGGEGKGFPDSIFLPVDNLVRYWFEQYVSNGGSRTCLGSVLHGIEDACTVHHAAGYCGNWHGHYEVDNDGLVTGWVGDDGFINEARSQLQSFLASTAPVPGVLKSRQTGVVPSLQWPIDMLVTWAAFGAYESYTGIYRGFVNGYLWDPVDARKLAVTAAAVGALALVKALTQTGRAARGAPASSLVAEPRAVSFEHVLPGEQPKVPLVLRNSGRNAVRITAIEQISPDFRVTLDGPQLPRDLDSGERLNLAIQYVPSLQPILSKGAWLGYPPVASEVSVTTEGSMAPLSISVTAGGIPTAKEVAVLSQRARDTRRSATLLKAIDGLGTIWRTSTKPRS